MGDKVTGGMRVVEGERQGGEISEGECGGTGAVGQKRWNESGGLTLTGLPVASFQASVKLLNGRIASPNAPTEGAPRSVLKPRAKKPPPGACLVPKETRKPL